MTLVVNSNDLNLQTVQHIFDTVEILLKHLKSSVIYYSFCILFLCPCIPYSPCFDLVTYHLHTVQASILYMYMHEKKYNTLSTTKRTNYSNQCNKYLNKVAVSSCFKQLLPYLKTNLPTQCW